MAISIGDVLGGLGAAIGGTGQQYVQGLQQREQTMSEQKRAELEARQKAMYQDAGAAFQLLQTGDLDGIIRLGQDRLEMLKTFPDADPSDTARVVQNAMNAKSGDPMALRNLATELTGAYSRGAAMGYIQPPAGPEIVPGSSIVDGQVITRDAQGNLVATRPQGFEAAPEVDETFKQETAEARRFILSNVSDINKSLAEVTTAYEKVSSLEPQMRAGNRSAINAAIMNTARLISPGVVTDRDAAAFSGANTNVGAMYAFLSGKGIDVSELVRIYDPSNPEIFDPDALLNVARSVTASALPAEIARFEDQKIIASQYGLSPQFVNSYLPDNSKVMQSVRRIQSSLGGTAAPTAPQTVGVKFNSLQEAEAAVNSGQVPVGTRVDITDAAGNVTSFVVEE
jgi:hypothetical protein